MLLKVLYLLSNQKLQKLACLVVKIMMLHSKFLLALLKFKVEQMSNLIHILNDLLLLKKQGKFQYFLIQGFI